MKENKKMSANVTEFRNKSDKFSPTILWEMAQSPHCGPAAVERSSPRACDNSCLIIFLSVPVQLCSSFSSLQPRLWSPL